MIKLSRELAYKAIINEQGNPMTSAIIVLEEIVNNYQLQFIPGVNNTEQVRLYSPLKDGWLTNYKYFEEKLGFKRYRIRYAFWKLEECGLIKRKVVPKPPKGTKIGGSELYIFLNLENIKNLLEL